MRATRVRPFVLGTVGIPLAGVAVALTVATADATSAFDATASVAGGPQYLGDTAGTAFTFTVTNTGTDTSLGAVEIERPSNGWRIQSCGTAPVGWSVQAADPRCRYRSGSTTADDIPPGASRTFTVVATTDAGTADRTGTWDVVVSRSNQFDQPSLLTAAEAAGNGLQTTAHAWEVVDAVVSASSVAPGSACPASDRDEKTNTVVTMVICGRNHASVTLTPTAGSSSLGGTFLQSSGTFSSGQIAANSAAVVVGNWSGAKVRNQPGQNLTVVATIGSSATQTSPATTFGGYEAINVAPIASNDAYSVAEDGSLAVPAPGVLANDSDPEGQPMTAVVDDGPDHAASFTLDADGSFSYVPAADFYGSDSFTYRAHDGFQASTSPATVTLTVTAVNDGPVNAVPASVSTEEETAYVFANAALSVSDVDSGPADVTTTLSVPNASVTVGTSGVTVTGNGSGDVSVTGPVVSVAAALDGASLTPAAGFAGTTTLTVQTSDLGNTGAGGPLTDTDAVSVAVVAVNDAPTFTAGTDQSVAEDAGAQSVAGWATAISAGPANEAGQTLTFDVTTDNPALFQAAPAISATTGTLTYQAVADGYGVANVTVVLRDDGGTANGGDDTSESASFTITVSPVNDAPSAANHSVSAHTNMRIHVTGMLAGASDTRDAGGPGYTPSFSFGDVKPLDCTGCTITNVNADGSFDFDPPAGGTGTYTLSYTVTDSGHPAPGETSAPGTITVTVSGPVIWFVDPSAAAPGTGRLSSPFSALPSATAAATGSGSRIYVASGAVSGNVAQPASGWLVGAGVTGTSFDSVMAITPPAGTMARPAINGTAPTITGGVSLADNSVVRGVSLAPASFTEGLSGNGDDGLTIGEVSVTATNARAVDIVASQGSTISLKSVSSTGGLNAIRLAGVNDTTPGSFTVTGSGTAGSGGVVTGATGSAVSLVSVDGVSLSWMTITGAAGDGVTGSDVSGVSLSDTSIANSGAHGVSVANPTGSVSMTRVTASGSGGDNARVFGSTGTSALTVTDSTFRDSGGATGGNGLLVQADGSAAMTFTGSGNSYLRNNVDGLAVVAQSSARTTATVSGGSYVTDGGIGLDLVSNGAGGLGFSVTGGSVTGASNSGTPVNVYKGTAGTGTGANAMAGTVSGMTVANGGSFKSPGIWVHGAGNGASRVAVTNNTVSSVNHYGIWVLTGTGGASMDATVTGNTVNVPVTVGALEGIQIESGTVTGDTASTCADIKTNTVLSLSGVDIGVVNGKPGTAFRLPGYSGTATDPIQVQLFLTTQNTITDALATVGTSTGFTGGAACAAP